MLPGLRKAASATGKQNRRPQWNYCQSFELLLAVLFPLLMPLSVGGGSIACRPVEARSRRSKEIIVWPRDATWRSPAR